MKSFLIVSKFGALVYAAVFAGLLGCGKPTTTVVQEVKTVPSVTRIEKMKNSRITLESLEQMFENMRSGKWNTDGELLWGYFFTDPDPEKLERLVDPLTHAGYRFGSIYPTDDGGTYFLHVERIEKHTPQSLYARNAEFYSLADEYDLESYDGMDVGPVFTK